MKKTIIVAMLVGVLTLVGTTKVSAGSCTSIIGGMNYYTNGYYMVGSTYSLASSYATATRERAGTYFYNYYSITPGLSTDYNRILDIRLMESDFLGNDDEVKVYTGTFKSDGRTLTKVERTDTKADAEIESTGDNVSELYLKATLGKSSGDSLGMSRSVFDYQLCQE